MTKDDFKKLLDESLKPLRKEQKGLREEQKELREIIEKRVLPPLMYVETTVKSYADRYVTNEDHIRRVDKKLITVEKNLGIYPPVDLAIPAID